MQDWIQQVFNAPQSGILAIPAGFLLGLITVIGCINVLDFTLCHML